MSSCIVQLDNFQGSYYPGSNVVGKVVCSFAQLKSIQEIKLKLRGTEHNSWTDTQRRHDRHRRRRPVQCTGHNKFLVVDTLLRGAGDIGPGRIEYPFNFALPKNIPGSYNGKYGSIKFYIKATVTRLFKTDYADVKEFIVISPIDFNEMKNELILEPVSYSDGKRICCCCCARGPITMSVYLKKEAFIQGETANVRVEITNMSNENVEKVEVKLEMTVESRVTSPKKAFKHDYELLATHHDTGVGAHGERTYDLQLAIPKSTLVPNFNLCELFKHWTLLTVKAVLPSCHEDLDISIPIVVGHIPIGGQQQYQIIFQQGYICLTQQNNQFPSGGVPYPSVAILYASSEPYKPSGDNSARFPGVHQLQYPSTAHPLPYSRNSQPTPYHPNTTPTPYPPSGSSMNFAVPQSTSSSGLSSMSQPNLVQYPVGGPSGSSASHIEDKSSAPSSNQSPPPSYNEAVGFSPYPKK